MIWVTGFCLACLYVWIAFRIEIPEQPPEAAGDSLP